MVTGSTFAKSIVFHLHAHRIRVIMQARLMIEALLTKFFCCIKYNFYLYIYIFSLYQVQLTFSTSLGSSDCYREILLAAALTGDRIAIDVVQFGIARFIAWCPDVHSFCWKKLIGLFLDT